MARVSVDATATTHGLSDLLPTLMEYVSRTQKGINIYSVGGWRTSGNYALSFTALHFWDHIYMQSKAFHKPHNILPACTIYATPKSDLCSQSLSEIIIMDVNGHTSNHCHFDK